MSRQLGQVGVEVRLHTLGCDIGGTFTDFVAIDEQSGRIDIHKCLTTPADPSEAVEQGVRALGETTPGFASKLATLIHGTTLVINAVIERKGARTGLITTRGFRDTLEIGREKRFDGYDLQITFPEPLVPRYLRTEADERLHATGQVLEKLDVESVRAAIRALLRENVESIAVVLLHSYRNPMHEHAIKAMIAEMAPGMPVSLSSDVLPEMKEFERTTTTVVNAYAKPVAHRYLTRLEERMTALGFGGELLLMLSSGGINSVETAREFPVQIIESGPAAGTLGAAHYARLAGLEKVLAFDMGGTTAKLALVISGKIIKTNDFEVAHVHRFKRGSGIPVRVPVVDLMEIGAGGGSIAEVTRVGTLQVGPESASADPGPACYGRGGERPTVSDADLTLGYLDAEHFLGGKMPLDRAAAEKAIARHVAEPLRMTVADAAAGVFAIVNENMAAAAKVYVTEHGESPNNCALVAFGGAGPVHAADLARRLGIKTVLIPPRAGVAAAFGMIVAPISYDAVRSFRVRLDMARFDELDNLFERMAAECRERLPRTVKPEAIRYERSADMRYVGQGYDVTVSLGTGAFDAAAAAAVKTSFEETYRRLYGRVYGQLPLEIMSLRMSASAPRELNGAGDGTAGAPGSARIGTRPAWCVVARQPLDHAVYRRGRLTSGATLDGPAIVEEDESTTIVPAGARLRVDDHGSLIITLA
jgi:N-methylhydantoinase A